MRIFLFLLIMLPVFASATSHDYYADIDIHVSSDGLVSFDGITNHPQLNVSSTYNFTFKNKAYWILNISLSDTFSDFIYRIHLPSGAVMNYFKASTSPRIESGSNGLLIVGTGQNKPLLIIIQYQIKPIKSFLMSYAILLIILVIIVIFIVYLQKKKRLIKSYDINSLTKRQIGIVRIIEKSKKVVTQAEIEKNLKIPKSSLSRNIDSLVKKGIIVKENKGILNIITMKKK